MKKSGYLLLFGLFTIIGCTEKPEHPKVTYKEPASTKPEVKIDTTQIKVSDLPVLMEGTKHLIYAIGDVRLYDNRSSKYGSTQTNSISYSISNYNRFELTGYLSNLKFQHIDSTSTKTLTDKVIEIHTITYLDEI